MTVEKRVNVQTVSWVMMIYQRTVSRLLGHHLEAEHATIFTLK